MQRSELSFEGKPIEFEQPIRPLHWVIKTSDLKKQVSFLEAMGCRVLRHEEFPEGCEASCNGPYGGHWSKTMIGWENEDNSFVFELTYNYGVNTYKRGNDLNSVIFYKTNKEGINMEEKLQEMFPESKPNEQGIYSIINDDMRIKFVDMPNKTTSLLYSMDLNVTTVAESVRYWSKLGLQLVAES